MTQLKKQEFKRTNYEEALRYMNNAKETLKKAGKGGERYYKDKKYVKTACGTAYNGVLLALDAWLTLKDVQFPKGNHRKTIKFYQESLSKLDRRMLNDLDGVYHALHLDGYYDGILDSRIIKIGFDTAYELIDKIKPN
ncbi:MAG: DUF5618 family protein [Elusimicrobiota bacterium]|jgi:hypothetical protein|nr:DUF5618 family protein [Elusimicrobiota bacterium]